MTLAEIFAKQPAVTALEEMELLTVTGTHSGVLAGYAGGKSRPHTPLYSSLSNLKSASMHTTCCCN